MTAPRVHSCSARPWVTALFLLAAACGGETDAAPAEASPTEASPAPQAATEGVAEPTPATTADTPAQPPDDSAARALLTAWLDAQNSGSFDAYAALYAERFEGIKRSGNRMRRYDHDGWLANRRRMFRRPMEVAASEIRTAQHGGVWEVRFTQSWASATYRDEGEKVLIATGEPLRIAREEMLESRIAGDDAADASGRFAFMLEGSNSAVIVGEPGEARVSGPVELVSREGPFVARRSVAPESVPEALRGRTRYRVHTAEGQSCEGRVQAHYVARRYTPHFGEVQVWSGDADGDGEVEGVPLDSSQLAATVWENATEGAVLVADLSFEDASCRRPLFALAVSDDSSATVWASTPVGDASAERAATTASQAYATIQRDFERDGGEGAWTAEGLRETAAAFAGGGHRVVVHTLGVGQGCGDFMAHLLAVYTRVGDTMTATPVDAALFGPSVVAVLDVNGDGIPELLVNEARGEQALLAVRRGAYRITQQRRAPNYDCDC